MAALAEVREALLFAFSEDVIDYEEFLVLYEINLSREVYPYWIFDKFDLSAWDEARCQSETRFQKRDLFILLDVWENFVSKHFFHQNNIFLIKSRSWML